MLLAQTDKQSKPLFAWGDTLMVYNGQRKYSKPRCSERMARTPVISPPWQVFGFRTCWPSHSTVNLTNDDYSKTSSWFHSVAWNRFKEKTLNVRDVLKFLVEQKNLKSTGYLLRAVRFCFLSTLFNLVKINEDACSQEISSQLKRCLARWHIANHHSKNVQLRKQ